jgi:hypothetical protein
MQKKPNLEHTASEVVSQLLAVAEAQNCSCLVLDDNSVLHELIRTKRSDTLALVIHVHPDFALHVQAAPSQLDL